MRQPKAGRTAEAGAKGPLRCNEPPPRLWSTWLSVAAASTAVAGLAMPAIPSLASSGFALMVYGSADGLGPLGTETVRYIDLIYNVLGSIMFSWGVAIFILSRQLFAKGYPLGWQIITAMLVAWFVPDTVYSALTAYWPNVILNVAFFVLLGAPLLATREHFR